MLIDGEPIRKKARSDYSKVVKDIDTAKAERERYHSLDQPEYRKWLNANFGELLTAIRDLQQKVTETEMLIEEVQAEFFFSNDDDISEAYRRVKNRRERREDPSNENASESADDGAAEEGGSDEEEEFRKLFEEMFGKEEDGPSVGGGSGEGDFHAGPKARMSQKEKDASARVKDLYRQLVRRLHPDHVANLTPKHVEWWHQTQIAYSQGNAEHLEMILVLTDIERQGTREASVGLLAKITSEFKRALRVLKSELSRFRKDPAWNFSTMADRRGIHRQTSFMLETQKAQLGRVLAHYELQVRAWEESSLQQSKRKRRGGRRRPVPEEEFLF